ncbi:hypothetical protein BKA61DRAFT_692348 [Leptodontidium sp. MPI-SDFR-AT-0119]|nr:hypothetical protein BKA61DRAFT_692348 [Leptodontidium sp. MPI-SDFR-AT-0119]
MIFEQVCAESPEMLPCLRLMCRRFDQIAAPLSYRRINLSANKLVASTGPFGQRNDILRNVHAHTRHVELRQLLDWDDVASLLAGCAQLDDLTWACGQEIFKCYFPEAIRRLAAEKWPKIRIFNEFTDYPGQGQSGNFLKTFPASNMISLTVHNRGFGQSVRPLYQFLTSCVNLETLRLFDLNDPSQPPNGRLPPVKCLLLQVRSWPYTPEEVHHLWNFSRLQDLEIPWHILGLMSQTMPPADFTHLHRLRTEHTWAGIDRPIEEYTQYHEMRTRFLTAILQEAPANQFRELDVKCHLPSFQISALSRHGRSLRILRLLDASGFEVDGSITPTTTTEDLAILQSTCPNLSEITLGINILSSKEILTFIDLLSRFRNITNTTLYMQKPPKIDLDHVPVTSDKILDLGQHLAKVLYEHKQGLHLSQVSINVGEWTGRKRAHRLVQANMKMDMSEAYQPRRLLNFSWDSQGIMTFEEATRAY